MALGDGDQRAVSMSMRRAAILAAARAKQNNNNSTNNPSDGGYNIPGNNASHNGERQSSSGLDSDFNDSVNVLLGGAMMSGVIIGVVLLCYCCHKGVRKNRPDEYSLYRGAQPQVNNMDVFTTHAMYHGQEPGEVNEEEERRATPCQRIPEPPPTYESLVVDNRPVASESDKNTELLAPEDSWALANGTKTDQAASTKIQNSREDNDLPTYEAALKLEEKTEDLRSETPDTESRA